MRGLSIGYQTITAEFRGSVRHLRDIRLLEVSVVPFPAQALAVVGTVKSQKDIQQLLAECREMQFIAELREMRAWAAARR